jgi:hypothetical protein
MCVSCLKQFQTLAFPNVKDPITFLYIWLINFVGDVANLIFLTSMYVAFFPVPYQLLLRHSHTTGSF